MNNSTLLLLIPACFALNMAPDPNNLLSVNNATHYGFWTSCFAGTERLIAFSAMIALTATGLPAALEASELFRAIVLWSEDSRRRLSILSILQALDSKNPKAAIGQLEAKKLYAPSETRVPNCNWKSKTDIDIHCFSTPIHRSSA